MKTKKESKTTTGIPTKDQIILRTRAGNRCSICKNPLVIDKPDTSIALRGEMAHIVGEQETAARGKSDLTKKERNCYSNLILLCKNHHEEIDKNENAFSIEKLHKIKSDHEQWVEETLSERSTNPDDLIYTTIIDSLTSILKLEYYNWFMDKAVRQLIHADLIDAYNSIIQKKLTIIWPSKYPELKKTIENLIESYINYIEQYLKGAELKQETEFYKPKTIQKGTFLVKDDLYKSDMQNFWAQKNFMLLCNYVYNLNVFANEVRSTYNPSFFILKGNFIIIDNLGAHLGESGKMWKPEKDIIEKRLIEIEEEKKKKKAFYKIMKNPSSIKLKKDSK